MNVSEPNMQILRNKEFAGERPLFASHGLRLENVSILPGESALKECSDIEAVDCTFDGKYPFWHVERFRIENCVFHPGARAALWYSRHLTMNDTLVEAPKMFREMDDLRLENVRMVDAQETLWYCSRIALRNVEVKNADYLFLHSRDIRIEDYRHQGNYSFQYCRDVVIRNAEIDSKDAFWNTENVTVYDSQLVGEYLGWHSRNLRLVNCRICGTQPLCYAENLVLQNCTFGSDADLAFERSSVHARICGDITSVKNPKSGSILAHGYGQVILDENIGRPADCEIKTWEQVSENEE